MAFRRCAEREQVQEGKRNGEERHKTRRTRKVGRPSSTAQEKFWKGEQKPNGTASNITESGHHINRHKRVCCHELSRWRFSRDIEIHRMTTSGVQVVAARYDAADTIAQT